jgi:hypothetical protein
MQKISDYEKTGGALLWLKELQPARMNWTNLISALP